MIIIGEKLNSSIPKTREALEARDDGYIISLIKAQAEAGAAYLDLNTAILEAGEAEALIRLVGLVEKYSECGIMLDSPSHSVLLRAAEHVSRPLIFNSVTATERINELLPAILKHRAGVVALPIDKGGIPQSACDRITVACSIIGRLTDAGVPAQNIYIDALVEAISCGDANADVALDTIAGVKSCCEEVNTICGLSNVSFGLPKRANLNAAFLAMAISAGLDAAIMDITSPTMKSALYASLALCGRDEYCMDYISYIREE